MIPPQQSPPLAASGTRRCRAWRVSGASLRSAQAQSGFDWKRFKGEKIEILLVKSPRGDLLSKYHKEFEDLTGIELGSEMVPEQQQRQKAVIELNSGNPSFDVIALSYHVQKRQFAKNNWLADLRPYINDKSMAAPDLDFADFAKGGLFYAVEAAAVALPFNRPGGLLQQSRIDAKGIAFQTPPKMIDAARSMIRPRVSSVNAG
jgi:multiple sugar transport system substrate-binding protein